RGDGGEKGLKEGWVDVHGWILAVARVGLRVLIVSLIKTIEEFSKTFGDPLVDDIVVDGPQLPANLGLNVMTEPGFRSALSGGGLCLRRPFWTCMRFVSFNACPP